MSSEVITKNDLKNILNKVLPNKISNSELSMTFNVTTGSVYNYTVIRSGNVVQLRVAVQNSSSTASGANFFEATIQETSLRPIASINGISYYGSTPLVGSIDTNGTIVIRNTSSSAFSAVTGSSRVGISFTYIVEP